MRLRRRRKKVGQPPGTLTYTGPPAENPPIMTLIDYDQENLFEERVEDLERSLDLRDRKTVTWLNIDGLHDTELIEMIGREWGLHPLTMEDIVHSEQRSKVEDFDNYLFIVLRMIFYDEEKMQVRSEQISLLLGQGYLLTFQERGSNLFDPVKERIRKAKGKIRGRGADYLAYALMDTVVDSYFVVLDRLGERIEGLEESLMSSPSPEVLDSIYQMKREVVFLRKTVWPLRECISTMMREPSDLITERTVTYLRDVFDHTIHVNDTIETYRDLLTGMLDLYLSTISNRMNEVMKVLTIIATIFIPLTFVAGIYGMNFNPASSPLNMPELGWYYGYPFSLVIMVVLALFMLVFFRRKGWI